MSKPTLPGTVYCTSDRYDSSLRDNFKIFEAHFVQKYLENTGGIRGENEL
mgnify:CR=1